MPTDHDDREKILALYWQPPEELVETRSERGVTLSYVSHINTQRVLDKCDPYWKLELVADLTGRPDISRRPYRQVTKEGRVYAEGETLSLWGKLTLLGVTRWGVGTVDSNKPDAEKELIGDLIRNAAMRHGIFGALWSKDLPGTAAKETSTTKATHKFPAAGPVVNAQPRTPAPLPEGTVDDYGTTVEEHTEWTDRHVEHIAGLLHSSHPKIMSRLTGGLEERGTPNGGDWTVVPPEEWVGAVLRFEQWAEKKAAERA